MKLLLRVLINALAFFFFLPMINGITFHGNFFHAIALGAAFALMQWLVAKLAGWLTAVLAIGTLGLALIVLVPLWLFGFWLLPGVALKLVGDFMPEFLTIAGWGPAIVGGIVMFVVSLLTGGVKVQGRVTKK